MVTKRLLTSLVVSLLLMLGATSIAQESASANAPEKLSNYNSTKMTR